MNDRIAIAWLTECEPVAVPVDSAVVRLSDALTLVVVPSGTMYAVFTGTSTVMRVPETAAADLHREHFENRAVQILHDHP